MSTASNVLVVQRLYDEILNGRDASRRVAAVDDIFSPTFVAYRSGREGFRGRERMKEFAVILPQIYGDAEYAIGDVIAAEDKVIIRWRITGTHQGQLLGVPATGKPLSFTGITIHRIVDGKIAEMWAEEDWLGALRQMGVDLTKAPPGE